jgi:16S rRNA (guanine527-N7)-methyltransferase
MNQLKTVSPIQLTDRQLAQFQQLYDEMLAYNSHTNLTSITKETDVIVKHFIDSYWLLKAHPFPKHATVLDVGTGPGYPGLPLKLIEPTLKLTLLDSHQKKIQYLMHVSKVLSLKGIDFANERAEDHALKNLNHYDIIVSRATANMTTLLELCIPMLRDKGLLYLYVTPQQIASENVMNALKILKTTTFDRYDYDLPLEYGKRSIMVFKKQKHVIGYPRPYATILKKGL